MIRSPNWLGDIILCLPAVQALRRAIPDTRLEVLVKKSMAQLWEMTDVDTVIPFSCRRGMKGLADRRALARDLKKRAFDTALIFPNSFDAALLPYMAGIPERAGWPTQGRGLLLNNRILYPRHLDSQQQPERDIYLISRWLGQELSMPASILLTIPADAKSAVAAQKETMARRIIGLNPGATYGPAKCWLPERFAQTALRAHAELGCDVIITGGPGDVAVCGQVYDHIAGQDPHASAWCRNLAGQTGIAELAAWLEQCACLVTNDTGGMHVSAAVGTPVVAIFGPTNWNRTAPLGTGHKLIKATVPCDAKCKRRCVADHRCMKSVTVDMVMQAVGEVMENG